MKFLLVLAVVFVGAAALDLPSKNLKPRQRFMATANHEGRIAGGQDADITKFSYQVGLALRKNFFSYLWCGGSLIAPNWVMTAAHCTEGINKLTVYLGDAKRERAEVEFDIIRTGDNIIEHEQWDRYYGANDISLIKIPTVTYSNTISSVRLPPQSEAEASFEGEYATASGWGRMGDSARSPASYLQFVTLRVISNGECSRYFERGAVTDGNICVATNDDYVMRSTCEGDSGGPLVLQGTNIQIGLTSFGSREGCEVGVPVAFTRVSHYIDWIVSKTGVTV